MRFLLKLVLDCIFSGTSLTSQRALRDILMPRGKNWLPTVSRQFVTLRDCETTIKIKFALFRGVELGGREESCPKKLFFLGNAMTIQFWKCRFCCREILLSWRRLLDSQLPSAKLSLKMLSKLPLPHKRGPFFSSFKIAPAVRASAQQLGGKNCLVAILASRHWDTSTGLLGYLLTKLPE